MYRLITSIFIFFAFFVFFGCSQENQPNDINLANVDYDFTSFNYDSKIVLKRDQTNLEQLFRELSIELFDSKESRNNKSTNEQIEGVDIIITPHTIIINPYNGGGSSSHHTTSDDEKCGGSEGDGWKSYGTCMRESCVQSKLTEAAAELSNHLSAGECLDLRVRRNRLNARVCGRVTSC